MQRGIDGRRITWDEYINWAEYSKRPIWVSHVVRPKAVAKYELNLCIKDGWPETRCPDLGDWSDTPHGQLDERHLALWIMIDAIKLDELRAKGYNNT
jgi:hypothetical protein